jgi:hypothetical protein
MQGSKETQGRKLKDKPMSESKLARLRTELVAIADWDEKYLKSKIHADWEDIAYRLRRVRRRQIVGEIRSGLASIGNA